MTDCVWFPDQVGDDTPAASVAPPHPIFVIPAKAGIHSPPYNGFPIKWGMTEVVPGNDKGRNGMTASAPGMTGSGMCPPSQAGNVKNHLIHSPDSHGLASRMLKQAPPFRREGIEGIICMDFYGMLSSNPRILESLI